MDAKPQRPRVLRVSDENAPIPVHNMAPGKTLHQRTKSTPAFSALFQNGATKGTAAAAATAALITNKKVLGEVNANARVAPVAKDDSEVGKASPGKISFQQPVKTGVIAQLARPAARPLAPRPSAPNMLVTAPKPPTTHVAVAGPEPVKKLIPRKSTKVLREVEAIETAARNVAPVPSVPSVSQIPTALPQPVHPAAPQPQPVVEQVRQEVHKVESVPLRDEAAPRHQAKAHNPPATTVPPGFVPQDEYRALMDYAQNPALSAISITNCQSGLAGQQQRQRLHEQQQQYYDAEETQYDYDDGYTTGRSFGLPGDNTATIVLSPVYTEKVKKELEEAKIYVDATRLPEDVEEEAWDLSMVAEYGDEIFDYMREKEHSMAPNANYMDQQSEIQWTMRAVLMDWVVQVHQRFNLLPETLFLTVNYIDRFLSVKVVSLGKLQLVGATAIFIAAKYEEVQCPTISEIIYMVDGGYSAEELLKAERFMLSMLQFELGWPGPMSFLRRISKADDYDLETRTLAKYFLEVTIMDERFVACRPSFLAAGAHCMARLMIYGATWSQNHMHYSNYTFHQLKTLLKAIWEACVNPREHHSAVYEKYTDRRYKRASTFVEGKMAEGFRLPFDQGGSNTQTMSYLDGMLR